MRRFRINALLGLSATLGLSVSACSGDDPPPVIPEIVITTESLPAGDQGVDYSATLSATGGDGAGYKWSIPTGSLPGGIFITSAGVGDATGITTTLSGRPTVNGRFTFTVALTDGDGQTGSKELTIELAAPPPGVEIVAKQLVEGSTQNSYTEEVMAMNGTPPYSWSIASGALPPGLNLTDDGASASIAGDPADFGSFDFTLRVTDSTGGRAEASFTIVIQNTFVPLVLVTTDLPDGAVGADYTTNIVASNGEEPYQWTLFDGPAGLELTAEGNPAVLAGVPTQRGNYTIQIEVEDATGTRIRRPFFLDIGRRPPPLRITTLALPGAEQNVAYTADVTAVNGSGAGYMWSITEGSLPPGLTLASGTPDATISGTPTGTGDFDFTLQVVDDAGNTFTQPLQISVQAEILPLVITTTAAALPDGEVGLAYTTSVSASGGFGSYNWVVTDGSLPAGLAVQTAGTPDTVIAGIAGETGTFTATITVFDDLNVTASKVFTLTVAAPANPVNIITASVPNAGLCEDYSQVITAENGSNNGYMWAVSSGSLPPGISLDPTGTPSSMLRGTPLRGAVGSYSATIEVTDSNGGVDTQILNIDVADQGNGVGVAAAIGDLEVDGRVDLFLADLCTPLPTAGVRVNNGATVDNDVTTGADDFAVSPDQTKIAFLAETDVVDSSQVYVADVTGGVINSVTNVTPTGWDSNNDAFSVKFSPDGNRLAFVADGEVNLQNEIYVADTTLPIAANSAVKITGTAPTGSDVSSAFLSYTFSSDSSRLAFVWDGSADNVTALWIADVSTLVAGNAVEATTNPTNADVSTSQVLNVPGTSQFIFAGDIGTDNISELWMVDATTMPPAAPVRLNGALIAAGDVQVATGDFGLSNDGTILWYFADQITDAVIEVFMVPLATPGASVRIGTGVSGSFPDEGRVQPGGTGLLVRGDLVTDNIDELFLFDLAGGADQSPLAARVNGTMQAGGDVLGTTDYAWSPDGAWIAYTADQETEGHDAAYVTPITGVTPGTATRVSPAGITSTLLDATEIAFSRDSSWVAFEGDLEVSAEAEAYAVSLGPTLGPWTQLTNVPVNGDVTRITFASPTLLLIGGDILTDNTNTLHAIDVSDPTATPAAVLTQSTPGAFLSQLFVQ